MKLTLNYEYEFQNDMRWPGIEPGSTAWKAAMLTTIPPTLVKSKQRVKSIYIYGRCE